MATVCAFILLAFALIIFVVPGGHRPSRTAACISNLSNLGKTLLMYEGDNDGMTPPGRWVETLEGVYAGYVDLKCPLYDNPIGYALNEQMVDVDSDLIRDPAYTVTFFDAVLRKDNLGDDNAIDWRHTAKRAVFGFADGHCRAFSKAERPSFTVALVDQH